MSYLCGPHAYNSMVVMTLEYYIQSDKRGQYRGGLRLINPVIPRTQKNPSASQWGALHIKRQSEGNALA